MVMKILRVASLYRAVYECDATIITGTLNSIMKNMESGAQSPTGLVAVNLLPQLKKKKNRAIYKNKLLSL